MSCNSEVVDFGKRNRAPNLCEEPRGDCAAKTLALGQRLISALVFDIICTSPNHPRARQIGTRQAGVVQNGTGHVGAHKAVAAEVERAELGAFEIGVVELGAQEPGAP